MQYAYGGIFLASLLLLPIYFLFVRKKHDEPWMFIFCICVSIVNLGYTLIALSGTVEFALFANKVAYLGQVMLPLCMFMMISGRCGYKYNKLVTFALIGAAALMYAIILTTGHLDWYYTDATIENVAGATILKKEYGVLHPTNLIYVLSYFVGMITVLCVIRVIAITSSQIGSKSTSAVDSSKQDQVIAEVNKAAADVDGAETANAPAPAAGDSYDDWD